MEKKWSLYDKITMVPEVVDIITSYAGNGMARTVVQVEKSSAISAPPTDPESVSFGFPLDDSQTIRVTLGDQNNRP